MWLRGTTEPNLPFISIVTAFHDLGNTSSFTCETPILCSQLMKLCIMNMYSKTDALMRLGVLLIAMCVDMSSKSQENCHSTDACEMYKHTHM